MFSLSQALGYVSNPLRTNRFRLDNIRLDNTIEQIIVGTKKEREKNTCKQKCRMKIR